MFEAAAQKILSPILSQYVENFSSQNLHIGLWAGKVKISEVHLKQDIFKKLNLPFKLKYSRLGSLTMSIPWSSITTSKTEIVLEGLQILINQIQQQNWCCKNTRIIDQRKKQIQQYCEAVISDFANKALKNANKQQQSQGYFSKLIVKVIDNLQITVKDIHIRYQDNLTQNYAFGVTLQQLKIFTVNNQDQQQFIDRTLSHNKNQPLRKKLILSNFGIYWNQRAQFFQQDKIQIRMYETIARQYDKKQRQLNYIILMSSKVKLMQRQPGKQFINPQIQLFIDFNQLKLQLMNLQLQQIIQLIQRLQRYKVKIKMENRKKLTIDQMRQNIKIFMEIFIKIYQKKSIGPNQNKKYQDILQKMDTDNFTPLIKNYLQDKQKQKLIIQKQNKSKGWFSGPKQLTQAQKLQIQNFLNENFGQQISIIKRPPQYFYIALNLYLNKLQVIISGNDTIKLINNKSYLQRQALVTTFQKITLSFLLRQNGYKINFKMNNIKIDQIQTIYNHSRQILSNQSTQIVRKFQCLENKIKQNSDYIDLSIEGNPRENIDIQVKLITQQLIIDFHPRIIKILKQFSDVRISSDNKEIAIEKYGQIKQMTSAAMNDTLKTKTAKKKFIAIDVTLNSATVILFMDPKNVKGNCWQVRLGQCKIYSDPQTLKKPEFAAHQPMQKYGLSLTNISLSTFPSKIALIQSHNIKKIQSHQENLLKDLSLDIEIELFQTATKQIPKIRLNSKLHELEFTLTQFSYSKILKISDCFSYEEQPIKAIQQQKIQRALEKAEVMKNSKKIGLIFLKEISGWNKYISVFSGNYIYFYADKKQTEYQKYIYTKNAILEPTESKDGGSKPFVLTIKTKLGQDLLGFERRETMMEWSDMIDKVNKIETQVISNILEMGMMSSKSKEKPSSVDPDLLNIQFNAVVELISLKALIQQHKNKQIDVLIKNITITTKIYQLKQSVKLSLKNIQLSDNIVDYKMKSLQKFLYSQQKLQNQKLIDISIIHYSHKHPSFQDIDSDINVQFGTLFCSYKPDTILSCMKFFIPPKSNQVPQVIIQEQSQINSTQLRDQAPNPLGDIFSQIFKQKQIFAIRLKLTIDQISVNLINSKVKTMIGTISLINFGLQFKQSRLRMLLNGNLQQITYRDYSNYPKTIIEERQSYQQVGIYLIKVSQSKQKQISIISFKIEILQKPKPNSKKTMFVEVTIKNLLACYFQQPVLRIINFINLQMLPSLLSQESKSGQSQKSVGNQQKTKKELQKPQQSKMNLIVKLYNSQVILQPQYTKQQKQKQFTQLLIQQATITNNTYLRAYLTKYQQNQQLIMCQNYNISLHNVGIFVQYGINQKLPQIKALTNQMDFRISVDLIQNTLYYSKLYKSRYLPGMRIQSQMTPFLLRINHQDYNFIMKCLNWCITYDDNADLYLYDLPQAIKVPTYDIIRQQEYQNFDDSIDPLYFEILLQNLALCVTQKQLPVSMLSLNQLKFKYTKLSKQTIMQLIIKNVFGTNLQQSTNIQNKQQKIIIQKGMFNSFGYHKIHKKLQLYNINYLVNMFSKNQYIYLQNLQNPSLKLKMTTNNYNQTILKLKIQQLKIQVQLKHLLTLSKLAIINKNIQPPTSVIQLHQIAKKRANNSSNAKGSLQLNIKLNNFMASLSDKNTQNYIVLEGSFFIKMITQPARKESQVIQKISNNKQISLKIANYIINVQNFCLYFSNIKQKKNRRQLLKPTKIESTIYQQYRYDQEKDAIFAVTTLQGTINKIIIQGSIKDIIKVNAILQDNIKIYNQNSTEKVMSQEQMLEKNRRVTDLTLQKSIMKDVNTAALQAVQKQIQKQIKTKTISNVKLEPLQIKVVNDCNGNFMPVIKFILQESKIIFTASAIASQLSYNMTINLSFFNPRSSKWEPIIQTYQISLVYLNIVEKLSPKHHLIINSSQIEQFKQLKFNISTQMITSMMQTLAIAKREKQILQQKGDLDFIQVSPFIFENTTNQLIVIKRNIQGNKKNAFVLEPFFLGSIRLSEEAEFLQFQIAGQNCKISLQHYGIVKVTETDYFVEFKIDKLNRFIRFLAPRVLTNSTNKQILCKRTDSNYKQQLLGKIIKPGMQLPLDSIVCFRLGFKEGSYTVPMEVKRIQDGTRVISQKKNFVITLLNEKSLIKDIYFENFKIRPIFVVYNCLPKKQISNMQ